MITIQRILVPTDFSPSSEKVLDVACTLATGLHASLHLVHVLEEPFVTDGGFHFHPADTPELRQELNQIATARLAGMAAQLTGQNIANTFEVRLGTATEGIVSAVTDYDADLVVMGTHGRTGLQHLLMGSVAEQVIRTARCPVLAVRESVREARVTEAAPEVALATGS